MRMQLIDLLEELSYVGATYEHIVSRVVELNDSYGCEGMTATELAEQVVYLSGRCDNDIEELSEEDSEEIKRMIMEQA